MCSGSGTIPDGRFMVYDADWNYLGNYTLDRSGPGNTFRPRTGMDVYNYAPLNYMQRPDERYAGGGFVNYEFNKHAQAYAEVMLMDDYTDAQIAPSGDFGNTEQLNCNNPMLSEQQRQLLCTDAGYGPDDIANIVILKRNVEGGGRVSQLRHTALRLVAGLKGELGKAWNYDFYGLNAEVHSPQSYLNDFDSTKIQNSLIVDGDPNDPSTWHCRSGGNCVPWNIFRIGGVTREALNYLQLPLVLNSGTRTRLASLKFNGDLREYGVAFPSATEGIQVALGAEYREEHLFVNPDQAYRDGIGAGQGGPTNPVDGTYFVKEAFTEVLIPIVQDKPGAKDLSLELGYRYSDYNTSGGHPSWKVQANWAPMTDFMFRAGVNRATRAPNVQELFAPQGLGLGGSEDICAGTNPTMTPEQCAHTGVSAAQYGHIQENPANQYNTFGGGNPLLVPEIADTTTFGIVVTPLAIPGFTAAIDYYDIQIEDTIGALGADDIIRTCATTGDPTLCALIHRDIAGTLWLMPTGYTLTNNQNIGKLGSEGVDLNANYLIPAGNAGFLSFNLIGTYLMESTIDTGLFAYDCKGYFGNQCGVPNPEWRHLARVSWETNFKTVFSLGWRMVGSVTNDDGSPNPAIGDPGAIELLKINDIYKIPAHHYLDLAATYKFSDRVQLTMGINNVADTEPPLAPEMQDNDYGTGFYGTYDPYGRYIFSSLQFNF